jgi:hypothetical protein
MDEKMVRGEAYGKHATHPFGANILMACPQAMYLLNEGRGLLLIHLLSL